MEAISLLINKAASRGLQSGYRVKGKRDDEVQVTHLFANGTLIFCKDFRYQMAYLSWVLMF